MTFGQLWSIFCQLVAGLPNLFIVIDRIEACLADEQADLVHQLLPALVSLGASLKDASVLVTSTMELPQELENLPFHEVYIDTSKKSYTKWQ